MRIGVPKEIKNNEFRVGLTPVGARELVDHGHEVLIQTSAGAAIGFEDSAYQAAGATIVNGAADIYASAELIVKVKEPQSEECAMLREGQLLFTYLHLAPAPELCQKLLDSGVIGRSPTPAVVCRYWLP